MPTILLQKDLKKQRKVLPCDKKEPKEIHSGRRKLNNKWSRYYRNPLWKNERFNYIQEHPLCEICLKYFDKITPVQEVHHKTPFGNGNTEEEKIMLLTDPDNYASLCTEHHDAVHNGLYPEYMISLDDYYKNKEKKKVDQ